MSFNVFIYFPLLQAALNKRAPIEEVELYFNLSEKVRHFTEDYFQLETPLYFSYTHLVCRSSIVGEFNRFNRLGAGGGGNNLVTRIRSLLGTELHVGPDFVTGFANPNIANNHLSLTPGSCLKSAYNVTIFILTKRTQYYKNFKRI